MNTKTKHLHREMKEVRVQLREQRNREHVLATAQSTGQIAICRYCGNDNVDGHDAECSSLTDAYVDSPVWIELEDE